MTCSRSDVRRLASQIIDREVFSRTERNFLSTKNCLNLLAIAVVVLSSLFPFINSPGMIMIDILLLCLPITLLAFCSTFARCIDSKSINYLNLATLSFGCCIFMAALQSPIKIWTAVTASIGMLFINQCRASRKLT